MNASAVLAEIGVDRLSAPINIAWAGAPFFAWAVAPLLREHGLSCELVEIYSAQRRTELVRIENRGILVFDHALPELFNLLNRLLDLDTPFLVAAALQRPLAEALREAQSFPLYAFFLRRSFEAAPLLRVVVAGQSRGDEVTWQNQIILLHEAAHHLPLTAPLMELSRQAARLQASNLANDLIIGMTGQFNAMLDDEAGEGNVSQAVQAWQTARQSLDTSDDAISSTYEMLANDPRFLEELACDFFAIAIVAKRLHAAGRTGEMVVDALVAGSKTFLKMRLVQYLHDMAHDWKNHQGPKQIDPVRLRLLVEMTFRGNAVTRQLLDTAEGFGLDIHEAVKKAFGDLQARYHSVVLNIVNEMLERTLLNPAFHDGLDAQLTADGFEPALLAEDPLAFIDMADALWQVLAAGSLGNSGRPETEPGS